MHHYTIIACRKSQKVNTPIGMLMYILLLDTISNNKFSKDDFVIDKHLCSYLLKLRICNYT